MQIPGSGEGPEADQHSLRRLHRRMRRLQDERIHLEGLLAHERSLLAQQQSDNASLRSLLACQPAYNIPADVEQQQADTARQAQTHRAEANQHEANAAHHRQQQMYRADARYHKLSAADDRQQHFMQHLDSTDRRQHLQDSTIGVQSHKTGRREVPAEHLQAELRVLQSENATLYSRLAGQRAESSEVRQRDLTGFWMSRQDMGAHGTHVVQMEAEHEVVVSELHAAKEQLRCCQLQVLTASLLCRAHA